MKRLTDTNQNRRLVGECLNAPTRNKLNNTPTSTCHNSSLAHPNTAPSTLISWFNHSFLHRSFRCSSSVRLSLQQTANTSLQGCHSTRPPSDSTSSFRWRSCRNSTAWRLDGNEHSNTRRHLFQCWCYSGLHLTVASQILTGGLPLLQLAAKSNSKRYWKFISTIFFHRDVSHLQKSMHFFIHWKSTQKQQQEQI